MPSAYRIFAFFLLAGLFVSFASAAYSSNQKFTAVFPFSVTSGTASSVFVTVPTGWLPPGSSSEFSCPSDWFKDAEYSKAVHCACAAPCRSFLSEGNVTLQTRAPNASGSYTWQIASYSDTGSLVSNQSQGLDVQQPAAIGLSINAPDVAVLDAPFTVFLNATNFGQALANHINASIRITNFDGNDASGEYIVSPFSIALLAGGQSQILSVTFTPNNAKLGTHHVPIEIQGKDDNSNDTLTAKSGFDLDVKQPAQLQIVSLRAPIQLSENQAFNASVLIKNTGGVAAQQVNVSLWAKTTGDQNAFLGSGVLKNDLNSGGLSSLDLTAQAPVAGSYTLMATANYVEAFSQRAKREENQIGNPLAVQTPAAFTLITSASLKAFSNDNLTVSTTLTNTGQAAGISVELQPVKSTGGCQVVGLDQKTIATLIGGKTDSSEWVFTTPDQGGICKIYFQAKGLDQNSVEIVASKVAVVDVTVEARETARFNISGMEFYQKDGQWYVSRQANASDWNVSLGDNSQLSMQISNLVKKQNQLEAKLANLELKMQADASDLPVGSKTLHSQITVDLLKPPGKDASLNLRILPAVSGNLPDVRQIPQLQFGQALAVVRVDKDHLINKQEIDTATLTLDVDKASVDAAGGPSHIQVVRDDEGTLSLIPTRLLETFNNTYRFEAFSQDGLSLFAMYAVEQAVPEEKPSSATGEVVLSEFYNKGYLAILMVVALVAAFAAIRYKNNPPRKGVQHFDAPTPKPKKPTLPPWEKHKIDKAKKGLDGL